MGSTGNWGTSSQNGYGLPNEASEAKKVELKELRDQRTNLLHARREFVSARACMSSFVADHTRESEKEKSGPKAQEDVAEGGCVCLE